LGAGVSAVGPRIGPFSTANDLGPLTSATYAWTVGASDLDLTTKTVFNAGCCRRVFCTDPGAVLYIKRIGDSAFSPYTLPIGGGYIDGVIVAIGGTTTGTVATTIVLEV
jgi:hypothetical protein